MLQNCHCTFCYNKSVCVCVCVCMCLCVYVFMWTQAFSAIILWLAHHWKTSWQHSMAWSVTWGDFLRMEYWRQTFFLWEEELVPDLPASGKKSAEVPGHWESEAVVACPGSDWSSAAYAGPRHYKWHGLSGSWLSCSGGAPPSLVLPDLATLEDKWELLNETTTRNLETNDK